MVLVFLKEKARDSKAKAIIVSAGNVPVLPCPVNFFASAATIWAA